MCSVTFCDMAYSSVCDNWTAENNDSIVKEIKSNQLNFFPMIVPPINSLFYIWKM